MRSPGRLLVFLFGSLAALALAACSSGTATSSPTSAAAGGSPAAGQTVDVTLQEWAVVPSSASVAAGDVTFAVSNTGPEDIHEFVVLKTDLDAGDLPVGESQDLSVSLDAGHYVLLCNIYSEAEQEAHYTQGMRTNFTVE